MSTKILSLNIFWSQEDFWIYINFCVKKCWVKKYLVLKGYCFRGAGINVSVFLSNLWPLGYFPLVYFGSVLVLLVLVIVKGQKQSQLLVLGLGTGFWQLKDYINEPKHTSNFNTWSIKTLHYLEHLISLNNIQNTCAKQGNRYGWVDEWLSGLIK